MKEKKELIDVVKIGGYFGGAILVAALALTGCGSSKSSMSAGYVTETSAYSEDADSYGFNEASKRSVDSAANVMDADTSVYEDAGAGEAAAAGVSADGEPAVSEIDAETISEQSRERKLIRNADISVQTEQFDKLSESIEKRTTELGGYIESSGVYNNDYRGTELRNANYTVRIPADRLDEFLDTALTDGKVTSKNISVDDITLRYSDLESRVKALKLEQDRLMELMSRAQDVDAIIALETRLSEIRYELDSIQSSLKIYDNQVTYSTVYVYVNEVKAVSSEAGDSFGEKIAAGFKNNLIGLGEFIENAAVFVIINIPAILLLIAVIAAAAVIVRAVIRKLKGNRNKKNEKEKGIALKADSASGTETAEGRVSAEQKSDNT